MNKIIVSSLVSVSLLFMGCNKQEIKPISQTNSIEKNDSTGATQKVGALRTLFWLGDVQDYICSTPSKNCLPTLIVKGVAARKVFEEINDAIGNNDQELFFASNDYSQILNTDFEFHIQDGLEKGHHKFFIDSGLDGTLYYILIKPQHENFNMTKKISKAVRAYPVSIVN